MSGGAQGSKDRAVLYARKPLFQPRLLSLRTSRLGLELFQNVDEFCESWIAACLGPKPGNAFAQIHPETQLYFADAPIPERMVKRTCSHRTDMILTASIASSAASRLSASTAAGYIAQFAGQQAEHKARMDEMHAAHEARMNEIQAKHEAA